jgi:hypothetical protein
MSNTTARRATSFLIVGVMVLAGLLGLVTAAPVAAARAIESPAAPTTGVTNMPSANALPIPDQVPYWKMDPQLRAAAAAGMKGWSLVEIYTLRNSELGPVLTKYGAKSNTVIPAGDREGRAIGSSSDAIAFRSTGSDGLPLLQRVWVPNSALREIASLPGVISISRPLNPQLTVSPRLRTPVADDPAGDPIRSLQDSGITPTNFPSAVEHGSLQVQTDYGIDGTGINIGLVDTTVDFGHPNLQGQWAVYQNPASPYVGWPIVLDRSSVLTNLELWTTASDFDRFPYPFFSSFGTANANFFADTHYQISDSDDGTVDGFIHYANGLGGYVARQDPTGLSGTVNLTRMNRMYYVGNSIDPNQIVSQSGIYRLGILKDDYLTSVYGGRVGLLLVDSTTAGVYDTVYADLDFDFDFTNEIPATQASPVLAKDLDGDGLTDISGGIVYFISPPTTAVTGEVVTPFWDAENETTKGQLANGNLVADVYGFFNLALPTLTMGGMYWPSAGEDIYEVLIPAAAGNEKGSSQLLTAGENILTFAPVDTTALLADYDLSHVYAVTRYDAAGVDCPLGCVLQEGVDYEIDMDTGEITWLHNFVIDDFIDILYEFNTWRVDFRTGEITFLANATAGSPITADYETGLALPYADILAERHGLDLFVPASGDLVGVYGAYDRATHGTGTASTAAGAPTNLMNCGAPGLEGTCDTWGLAPGAKIISIDIFKPNGFGFDAWYFAVEGADGIPGTGDEANIVSNSWGWVDLPESGWEDWSRFKYFLNTIYAPDVVFVQSTGNDGQGYATESSPTASSSIQVGAAISADIYWLLGLAGGDQFTWPFATGPLGPGPYGDVADFSSRGPNALGQPGPDILGVGHGGIAGIPVNSVFNGQDAWDLFGGTSEAAPNIAGIVALIMEAYAGAHAGAMPSGALVRSILKTTADDVHRETVSQGAGFADAMRAVKAAMEMDGVTADVHEWIPGDYRGVTRDMFLNLLRPGASDSTTITLTNHGTTAATVDLSDGVYARSGTFSFQWTHTNVASNFWVLKKDGVYRSHGNGFPGDGLEVPANLAPLWDTADFMKVWTYSDPNIGKQTSALILYDWFDVNGNGIWNRLTEESLIGPLVFEGDFSGSRINAKPIYDPANRIHTGLGVRQTFLTGSNDGTPIPTTLFVEFYQRVDSSWLSVSPSSVTIPAGGTATVTATVTVPTGTAPASYDAGIYYTDGSNVSTIQVLVNVPAISLPVSFGGGTVRGGLYEPNAFGTGFMAPAAGDGRWIWIDAAAVPASNRKMLYNLNWGSASSDAEILAFAPVADPEFTNDATYGPSTFALLDATKRDAFARDTIEPGWEFLSTDVQPGLFFVKVQALRTTVPGEPMQASIGIMTTNTDDVRVSSNHAAGAIPVTITSQVPMRSAFQVDASGALVLKTNTTAVQGETVTSRPFPGGAYIDYLYNQGSFARTETVVGPLTRAVTWTLSFGGGATDVDMGIFYDADCDGTYTVADDVIGYIVGSTFNNPETATVDPPGDALVPAGCYWVHAAGVSVTGTGTYDVTLDEKVPTPQGIGIAATQAESTVSPNIPVQSFPFPGGSFIAYLFSAPNRFETEVPVGTIIASWTMLFHSGADDVDFGLFFDANCDGAYTVSDDAAGTVAATGSNPERATLSFPAPGCYWLHAAGFTVAASGGLFDLTFAITKVGVSAFLPANVQQATIPADTSTSFDILWSFGSSKPEEVTTDFIFVSPGNAPFALAQQITVTFSYDLTPPSLAAQLPAPGSIVSDPFVGIFAQFSDTQAGSFANTGEIDQSTLRIWVDGTEVTSLATVSAPPVTNVGYPEGIILFTPSQALTNGAHTVTVEGGDFAGNVQSASWTFTVDTAAPTLTIDSPTPGFATSAASVILIGHTEFGAAVTVSGQLLVVDSTGQFTTAVSLIEGTNTIDVSAVDGAGNAATTSVVVIRDTGLPAISLLRSSAGLLTNKDLTVVSGVVSEAASVTVAGVPAMVHVDGSFEAPVRLVEGPNAIAFVARDEAGNQATVSLTVVRDSTPPTVSIDALPTEVSSASITVTGAVESGIGFVTVNGQPVTVSGGRYTATVALSFGSNVIFVEATDAAGNSAVTSQAVSYVPQGVSTASIGLILLPVLTVIALLAGLAIGQARGGRGGGGGGGGKKMEEMTKEEGATAEEEILPPEGGEL